MNDPMTNHIHDDGDALRITRPEWFTDDQWAQFRRNADAHWVTLFGPNTERCPDRPWCVMGGPSSDHDAINTSAHIDLNPEDPERGWFAWLSETRPDGPVELVIDETHLEDFTIPAVVAAALLSASEPAPARAALFALLEHLDQ